MIFGIYSRKIVTIKKKIFVYCFYSSIGKTIPYLYWVRFSALSLTQGMAMFLSELSFFSYQRFWMLTQTYYLFNSFSLPWNMRGAPRDHWFYLWSRLSFLNTETLLCQIRRSSLNGPAFTLEWAFRHSGLIWLTAEKEYFAFWFTFHLVESS